jgi:hypothetical protein
MTKMRAKVRVGSVLPIQQGGETTQERLVFHGVAKTERYPEDGSDEDNTFAKFSPSVLIDLNLANPALIGQFEPGQTFYVDFTPVVPVEPTAE